MPVVNIAAFERLIEILEAEPDYKSEFDLKVYARKTKHECGSAVCAIGLAMQDPWFNERGFTIKDDTRGCGFDANHPDDTLYVPVYKTDTYIIEGNVAACDFFGIDMDDFNHMFLMGGYRIYTPTQRDVAKRLREFVAKQKEVVA